MHYACVTNTVFSQENYISHVYFYFYCILHNGIFSGGGRITSSAKYGLWFVVCVEKLGFLY